MYSGYEATMRHNMVVLITAFLGGDDRNGSIGGGDIRPPPPEYHSSVHHDPPDTGAVSGSGAADGNMDGTECQNNCVQHMIQVEEVWEIEC